MHTFLCILMRKSNTWNQINKFIPGHDILILCIYILQIRLHHFSMYVCGRKIEWKFHLFLSVIFRCWYKWKFKMICKRWTEADKNFLSLFRLFSEGVYTYTTHTHIHGIRQQSICRFFHLFANWYAEGYAKRIYHKNVTQRYKVPITPEFYSTAKEYRTQYNWETLKSITNSFLNTHRRQTWLQ